MTNRSGITLAGALIVMLSILQPAHANVLENPGFEQGVGTPGDPHTFTGLGLSGVEAAGEWPIHNYNDGTTTCWEETPPVGVNGTGQYSLLVSSTVAGNGVEQQLNVDYFAQSVASISGYVYVVSGSVGIGLLDSENAYETPTIYSSTAITGQWVFLSAQTDQSTVYDFDILALSPNTEFYVDNVDAEPTPEPATLTALGLGAFGVLRRRKSKGLMQPRRRSKPLR